MFQPMLTMSEMSDFKICRSNLKEHAHAWPGKLPAVPGLSFS